MTEPNVNQPNLSAPSSAKKSTIALLLLTGLSLVMVGVLGRSLPIDGVPIHFDGAGNADQFSTRSELILLNVVLLVANLVLFLGMLWFVPRIPDHMINLKDKDYWLAPERRAQTMDQLCGTLGWIGVATVLLVAGIFVMTWRVGMQYTNNLGVEFWLAMAIYLAYIGYACLKLTLMNKPQDA